MRRDEECDGTLKSFTHRLRLQTSYANPENALVDFAVNAPELTLQKAAQAISFVPR